MTSLPPDAVTELAGELLHRRGLRIACVLVTFVLTAGCSKESRLIVAPVRGRVTYKGQGVPKAIVIFSPTEGAVEKAKKMRPFGYADDQGNFELKTYVDGDGAPLGKYRVSIIAVATPSGAMPAEISKKYGSVETAGIEVDVKPGENSLPPFDLKAGTGA
ncbi:MAG TPA: hypothetical protein VHU84_00545 [Lacipirellulaceae bacterium]|jgi:hypothetical protein|nr:hypothetical protein [Lacipirellulaceae bacterium]